MPLRMPKNWEAPHDVFKSDPSIILGFRIPGRQGWKYLDKDLIMQLFDEIDDTLIYNSDYGKNPHEVVTYYNGLYWIVVHPSATETIKSLDTQFSLGIFLTREITKVPNGLVNILEYWNR